MAPRLFVAATTTPLANPRLLGSRIPLHRILSPPTPTPARCALQPLSGPPPPCASTSRRAISTSWLLSALPNLPLPSPQNPPPPKTLRARRILPYPPAHVYALIADIDSYSAFLPHCTHSRVTRWTTTTPASANDNSNSSNNPADPAHHRRGLLRRLPAQADLTVGWGPVAQTYTSRVYCVPGSVVEAVSGADAPGPSIPRDVLRRAGYGDDDFSGMDSGLGSPMTREGGVAEKSATEGGGIFKSLVTRWTVEPVTRPPGGHAAAAAARAAGKQQQQHQGLGAEEQGWSEVTLSVTFQFANPALGFAVGQVADGMVDEMVEAFEERARRLYGRR